MKILINSQEKLAEAIGAIQRTSSSSPEKPSLNEALSYCPETGLSLGEWQEAVAQPGHLLGATLNEAI